MDWVILLPLVLAIVVPVVLLFGFAGCSFTVPTGLSTPTIVSATPLDSSTIDLKWTDTNGVPVTFEVERTKGNDPPSPPFAAVSPFIDTLLEGGTKYAYRVRTIHDGNPSSWSDDATVETWALAFTGGLVQGGQDGSVAGDCIVQRLSPGTLSRGGNLVSITVRSATAGDLILSRVTISAPALGGQDFDSAAAPKDVAPSQVDVTAGLALPLQAVEFNVDIDEPLLVAFDVGTPGNGRFASGVVHTMYIKEALPGGTVTEAGTQNRAGFVERSSELWFIDRVDIATKWPPVGQA